MPEVLVASDSSALLADVDASLSGRGTTVRSVRSGLEVAPAVQASTPDLVVLDLQIGNMGGIAACLNLRLEESGGRLPHVPVLILLDRRADVFLARRALAEGWILKPIDPLRLRRAALAILDGGTFEDPTGAPSGQMPSPRSEAVG